MITSSFLGSLRRTQVRLPDDSILFVQHDVADQYQPGEAVNLKLKGKAVLVGPR